MLAFTVALAVLPVSSYYLSRDYYFGRTSPPPPATLLPSSLQPTPTLTPSPCSPPYPPPPASPRPSISPAAQGTTGAGITAATVANLVLGGFIWVAFQEDGKGVQTAESKAAQLKKKN